MFEEQSNRLEDVAGCPINGKFFVKARLFSHVGLGDREQARVAYLELIKTCEVEKSEVRSVLEEAFGGQGASADLVRKLTA